MAIRSAYDPAEDRIRLSIEVPDKTTVHYAVTRKGWLSMYLQARSVAKKAGVQLTVKDEKKEPTLQKIRKLGPQPDGMVLLRNAQMQLVDGKLQINFVADQDQNLGLTIPVDGLVKLEEMFAMQADRAGWDAGTAFKRMRSEMLARAALKQASNKE